MLSVYMLLKCLFNGESCTKHYKSVQSARKDRHINMNKDILGHKLTLRQTQITRKRCARYLFVFVLKKRINKVNILC